MTTSNAATLTVDAVPFTKTGIIMWWDAADDASFSYRTTFRDRLTERMEERVAVISGSILDWSDKSGNSYARDPAMSASTAVREAGAVNGLASVVTGAFWTTAPADAPQFTVTSVSYANTLPSGGGGWVLAASARGGLDLDFNGAVRRVQQQGTADLGPFTTPMPVTTAVLSSSTFDGTTVTNYHNGVLDGTTTTAPAPFPVSTSWLGSSGAQFDGYFCEIIKWDRILPDVERQTAESYLRGKWGVS